MERFRAMPSPTMPQKPWALARGASLDASHFTFSVAEPTASLPALAFFVLSAHPFSSNCSHRSLGLSLCKSHEDVHLSCIADPYAAGIE